MASSAGPAPVVYRSSANTLDGKTLEAYVAKIRPYKIWHSTRTSCNDTVTVDTAPGVHVTMTYDAYQTWPGRNVARSMPVVRAKPAVAEDLHTHFQWGGKGEEYAPVAEDAAERDPAAKAFVDGLAGADSEGSRLKKHDFFGLVDFFRPSLSAAINLMAAAIPLSALDALEALFVTAETSPDEMSTYRAYDNRVDMHQAKVTVYTLARPAAVAHTDAKSRSAAVVRAAPASPSVAVATAAVPPVAHSRSPPSRLYLHLSPASCLLRPAAVYCADIALVCRRTCAAVRL
jgi:hypothetical protein